VTSGYTFRGISAFKEVRLPMETADADDIEEDTVQDMPVLTSKSKIIAPGTGNKSARIYRARSGLDDTPLFLLHCSFRV